MRRQVLEQRDAGFIGPLQVVEQDYQRTGPAEASQEFHDRVEQEALLLFGMYLGRFGDVWQGTAQVRQQPGHLRRGVPQRVAQCLAGQYPDDVFEDFADNDERRAAVLVGVPGQRQQAHLAADHQRFFPEPGLADARFTTDQHDAPGAVLRMLQALTQGVAFGVPADQRAERLAIEVELIESHRLWLAKAERLGGCACTLGGDDAFWRPVVDPRQHQRNGKASGGNRDQHLARPARQLEQADEDVADLQHDPGADRVAEGDREHLSSDDFFEEMQQESIPSRVA